MEKHCSNCRYEPSPTCRDIIGLCYQHNKWQPKQEKSCKDCWYYEDCYGKSCNINICYGWQPQEEKKSMKIKKVVLELPSSETTDVTYNWLKEQGACIDGIDWFVNAFGNRGTFQEVYDRNKIDGRPESDREWLSNHEQFLKIKNDEEYVHVSEVDSNKLYILIEADGKNIYKSCTKYGKFFFSDMNNSNTEYGGSDSMKEDMEDHLKLGRKIYEFNSFDDFVEWYMEQKKL